MTRYPCLLLIVTLIVGVCVSLTSCDQVSSPLGPTPVKIGILHSQTGSFAYTEKSMIDAALLAVKHVNDRGGIMGRPLQAIVYDGASTENVFESGARELIEKDQVVAIFGCLASNCRKRVKNVVEQHNSVLFYPMPYEGLEASPNIIYTGAAPNQKVFPVVKWSIDNLGDRFYLVGTDTLFSNIVHHVIKDNIQVLGGSVVGDAQFPMNNLPELAEIIHDIAAKKPDVILGNLGRSSCEIFLSQLQNIGITAKNTPIFIFGMSAYKIYALENQLIDGAYSSWCYDEALDSPENKEFVEAFRSAYGKGRVLDEPMEAAYDAVLLWAKVANGLKTTQPEAIIKGIHRFSIKGPSGAVYISEHNRHAFRRVRIGRIDKNGTFNVHWDSEIALEPEPFPLFRTKKEWDELLAQYERVDIVPML